MDRQIIDIIELDIDDASKALLVADYLSQPAGILHYALKKRLLTNSVPGLFSRVLCPSTTLSLHTSAFSQSQRPIENQVGAKLAESFSSGPQAAKFWAPLCEGSKAIETFFDLSSVETLASSSIKLPSPTSIHGLDRFLQLAQPHIKSSAAQVWKHVGVRLSNIISAPTFDSVAHHALFVAIIMLNGNSGRAIMPFDALCRPLLHWLASTPLKVQTYENATPSTPQISKSFATQLEWLLKVFSMATKINKKLAGHVIEAVLGQLLQSDTLISPVLPLILPNTTPELEHMSLSLNEITILKVLPIILNWPMTNQVGEWTSLLILRLKYLITHKQKSKAEYDKQIRNWFIMVEKAIDVLGKSLFHRKCRHSALKVLSILLNSLQRSPKAFLKLLPLLKSVLILYIAEVKGFSVPTNASTYSPSTSSNSSNNTLTSSAPTNPIQSAKSTPSSQLALPLDLSSVVSYLQIAELENLEALMKETAPHDSVVTPTQQKDPEIEETLRNLGKLLFIQMHNHKGHPEAYIPVYDHLRQHLCVDVNGNASELISTIEMDLQLKADSWAYVSSSSFNMFERSGNHNPIELDDVDEQLEFSALSDDETDNARSDFKKALGIAGLVNLGNTCYMNSVVQVLNQTISFRKAVFQGFEDAGTSASLLRELQYTFAALCLTNRSAFAPRTLISTLPDWIKGGRQHDASELGKAIFGILDSHWTLTRKKLANDRKSSEQVDDIKANEKANVPKSPIERIFGGSVLTSVRCKSCGSISTRTEAILDLSLTFPVEEGDPPDGKRRKQSDGNPGSPAPVYKDPASLTLETLLQHFMKAETMEGQNQYHCSTCQKLVDAEKIQQVSSAPDHLIVNLVRFRYDYKTQIRSKILTEVEFKEHLELPVLDLHSSNAEQLSSTPNENRMDTICHPNEDNIEHPNHAANLAESGSRLTTVSYTLYGCVMHSGRSVEHGHYYSYARASIDDEISPKSASSSGPSTTSPWFRFNDESVDSSSFESFSRITKHFPADVAYILLYKRNDVHCANPSSLELSSPETALSTTHAIPSTIVKRVQDDNEKAEVERRMRKKSATQTRQALFSTRSRFDDAPFGGGNGSGGGGLGGGPFGGVGPGGGLGGFGGWVS